MSFSFKCWKLIITINLFEGDRKEKIISILGIDVTWGGIPE